MANTIARGGQPATAAQFNQLVVGDTTPSSPTAGDLWTDTTYAPTLKIRGTSSYTTLQAQANPLRLIERTADATVTGTSDNQTLLSVANLNVPTTSTLELVAMVRATVSGRLGLAVNGTTVNTTATTNHYWPLGTGNRLYECRFLIGRRDSGSNLGYLCIGSYAAILLGATASIPTAAITSVTLLSRVESTGSVVLEYLELLEHS